MTAITFIALVGAFVVTMITMFYYGPHELQSVVGLLCAILLILIAILTRIW